MTDVFFICVNYNNSHFTIKYIESVHSLKWPDNLSVKTVVVDNCSAESDYQKIKDFIKGKENVYFIQNPENRGYFSGLNSGMELIDKETIRFAIIGNNDLEFDESFPDELQKFENRRRKDVLAIAPNIINLDGDRQNPVSVNRLSYPRRIFLRIYFLNYYVGMVTYMTIQTLRKIFRKSSRTQSDKELEITIGYGACYVLTHDFFNFYSKLDDSIFLYGEEALFGNQIRTAGGVLVYLPGLKVRHFEHATARNIGSKANYKITQDAYNKYRRYL